MNDFSPDDFSMDDISPLIDQFIGIGMKAWTVKMAKMDTSRIIYNDDKCEQFDRMMLLANNFVNKHKLKFGECVLDQKLCVDMNCFVEVICPFEMEMDKEYINDLVTVLSECDGFNISTNIDNTILTFFVSNVFVSKHRH